MLDLPLHRGLIDCAVLMVEGVEHGIKAMKGGCGHEGSFLNSMSSDGKSMRLKSMFEGIFSPDHRLYCPCCEAWLMLRGF